MATLEAERAEAVRIDELRALAEAKRERLRAEVSAKVRAEEEARFRQRQREAEERKLAQDALAVRREELEARHQALVHGETIRHTTEAQLLASSLVHGAEGNHVHERDHEAEELNMRLQIEGEISAQYDDKFRALGAKAASDLQHETDHHKEARRMAELEIAGSKEAIEAEVRRGRLLWLLLLLLLLLLPLPLPLLVVPTCAHRLAFCNMDIGLFY